MKELNNRLNLIAKKLEKNNMKAYIVSSKDEIRDVIKKLINKGDTIACGGSMSLKECGVIDLISNGDYNYIDRNTMEAHDAFIKAFSADTYLCSCNAITENGELYNVDGNSNRIAAIAYGPTSVIMVVGINKIVKNLDEAAKRVKTIAAPKNCIRLNINSYCSNKGKCKSLINDNPEMCEGCHSDSRICCNYLISARQRIKDRIKVILVPEELGF